MPPSLFLFTIASSLLPIASVSLCLRPFFYLLLPQAYCLLPHLCLCPFSLGAERLTLFTIASSLLPIASFVPLPLFALRLTLSAERSVPLCLCPFSLNAWRLTLSAWVGSYGLGVNSRSLLTLAYSLLPHYVLGVWGWGLNAGG